MPRDAYEVYMKALAARRAPAERAAAALIAEGRHEEAERAVRAVDDSIYGAVALGRLFTERLRALAGAGEGGGEGAREVFRRALRWRESAFPEAHTEMEASQYDEGRARARAELVEILGHGAG